MKDTVTSKSPLAWASALWAVISIGFFILYFVLSMSGHDDTKYLMLGFLTLILSRLYP